MYSVLSQSSKLMTLEKESETRSQAQGQEQSVNLVRQHTVELSTTQLSFLSQDAEQQWL